MGEVSLIYRNIRLYRLVMNILYTSGYKKRFKKVIRVIDQYHPQRVLELCFGDIFIANHCRSKNISWMGIDSNEHFVKHAKNKGFDATCVDLIKLSELPKADVCVIIGSLYHFHSDVNTLLSRMLNSCNTIIISEPVKNLTGQDNLIGRIAERSADAGKGDEQFRYNATTLKKMLEEESKKLNFDFKLVDSYKKDSIIVIEKNGSN